MKDKYMKTMTSFLTRYHDYTEDELDNIRYSLEGVYLSFTKLVVIVALALILGICKELLILLVLFNIIRFPGFGFHARKSSECLICSTLLFIGVPILLKYVQLSKFALFIIGSVCTVLLAIYAPADTVKRPLPNKKKRKIRKIATTIIAIIYTIISFYLDSYNYTISYLLIASLMLETIMVNPLTYKLFKQPYRNYLNYQKA